jgi:enoyl-CoA hydratase
VPKSGLAACDFIYAARSARFALTEVTLGIMPGAGGTQNLTRAVRTRRAKEVILTGKSFSAEETQRWGLVNEVVEFADLMDATVQTVRRITENAPISVKQAKQAIQRGVGMSIFDGSRSTGCPANVLSARLQGWSAQDLHESRGAV